MFDVHATMRKLAERRPIFHSEADFQHELAWQMRLDCKDICIRLEYRIGGSSKREHIDIIAYNNPTFHVFELKYKVHLMDCEYNREKFSLRAQGGDDVSYILYLQDIERLERNFDKCGPNVVTYPIFLTNFLKFRTGRDSYCNIIEGQKLQGLHRYRNKSASLSRRYVMRWRDFSTVTCNGKSRSFIYGIAEPVGA